MFSQETQRIFLQTLALCHTVQVAADNDSPPLQMEATVKKAQDTGNKCPAEQSDHQSSDPLTGSTVTHLMTSDHNPLLGDMEKSSHLKRPQIVKRLSPKLNRVSVQIEAVKEDELEMGTKTSVNSKNNPEKRQFSVHFKRSTSELDLPCNPLRNSEIGSNRMSKHRRTQSYGAQTERMTPPSSTSKS